MNHHPSCTPNDRDLVWHCNQCGLNEPVESSKCVRELGEEWSPDKIPECLTSTNAEDWREIASAHNWIKQKIDISKENYQLLITDFRNLRETYTNAETELATAKECIIELCALMDEGILIRNTEKDRDFSHFSKQGFRLISVLKKAQPFLNQQTKQPTQ